MALYVDQVDFTSPALTVSTDGGHISMVGDFRAASDPLGISKKGAVFIEIQVNSLWHYLPKTTRNENDAYQLNLSPDQVYRVVIQNCTAVTVETLV